MPGEGPALRLGDLLSNLALIDQGGAACRTLRFACPRSAAAAPRRANDQLFLLHSRTVHKASELDEHDDHSLDQTREVCRADERRSVSLTIALSCASRVESLLGALYLSTVSPFILVRRARAAPGSPWHTRGSPIREERQEGRLAAPR
jgi:hypothetical protein